MKKIYMPITLLMALITLAVSGCHRSNTDSEAGSVSADTLPDEITRLIKVVKDGNRKKFADLVSYPLSRPYPLHDITSKDQMIAYYPIMMDDSITRVIADSRPSDWSQMGWRGWMLDDGRYLWMDDAVYSVNYLSKREAQLRDSLISKDMGSIDPHLREGWIPETCYQDTVHNVIYRIDVKSQHGSDENAYRLAIYNADAPLNSTPVRVITGSKRYEGTANFPFYDFEENGSDFTFFADYISDDDGPSVKIKVPGAETVMYPLIPVYWLDLVKQQGVSDILVH